MKRFFLVMCICFNAFAMAYTQQDSQSAKNDLSQLPEGSMIQKAFSNIKTDAKGFTVIKTEIIECPPSWNGLSKEEKQLKLFNIVSGISTQKGITYISRRAGYKEKVLYTDSYYIEDDSHADPVCEKLPNTVERFAVQDDSTFGSNKYRHVYTNTNTETLLEATNLTEMKYHGITCIKEGELTVYTSIMQSDSGIVLTTATRVNNQKQNVQILFWNVDLADSFNRRTDSVFEWFKNQISINK